MIEQFDVDEVVPHGEQMILIDRILEYDDSTLMAEVVITEESHFLNDFGQVPAWVGVEYMAQAIAAWAGIKARLENREVGIGFLLGARRFESTVASFKLQMRLIITIQEEYFYNGMGRFACKIIDSAAGPDQDLVSANLSVYQPAAPS